MNRVRVRDNMADLLGVIHKQANWLWVCALIVVWEIGGDLIREWDESSWWSNALGCVLAAAFGWVAFDSARVSIVAKMGEKDVRNIR